MPGLRKHVLGSFQSQIAAGDALVGEMAFANAGAIQDPLVGGVDHLFQVSVGKQAGRNIGSKSADLGAQQVGSLAWDLQLECKPAIVPHAYRPCPMRALRDSAVVALRIAENEKARHRRPTAHARARYRCFLPDLAGLAGSASRGTDA